MSTATQPLVTLCVINYNGAHYLGDALHAAVRSEPTLAEVLVIDNASTDGSLDFVRSAFPSVRILALDRNDGPGRARNAGLKAAQHDLVLFQDNDVVLHPHCAARLAAALESKPNVGITVPRVLYQRDPATIQYEGALCHFLGLMAPRLGNRPSRECSENLADVTSVVGACFLLDRRRWGDADVCDADFFTHYEDHDFGMRAKVWGHDIVAVGNATVLHGAGTEGLSYRPGYAYAPRRIQLIARNRWLTIAKNYSARSLLLLLPMLLVYESFQVAGMARKGWLREWWTAVCWVATHLPLIARKRAAVQARRRSPDRDFLIAGPLPVTMGLATTQMEKAALATLQGVSDAYWRIVRHLL